MVFKSELAGKICKKEEKMYHKILSKLKIVLYESPFRQDWFRASGIIGQ